MGALTNQGCRSLFLHLCWWHGLHFVMFCYLKSSFMSACFCPRSHKISDWWWFRMLRGTIPISGTVKQNLFNCEIYSKKLTSSPSSKQAVCDGTWSPYPSPLKLQTNHQITLVIGLWWSFSLVLADKGMHHSAAFDTIDLSILGGFIQHHLWVVYTFPLKQEVPCLNFNNVSIIGWVPAQG